MTASGYDPLGGGDADGGGFGESWFACVRRWISWRGGGSNRLLWKSLCSAAFLGELAYYYHLISDAPQRVVLSLMAAYFGMKGLAEVWGQDTPTWICPGGPIMFLIVYGLGFPGVMWLYGSCIQSPDIVFPGRDLVALALYVFGSSYSLYYEVNRFAWKKDPANKGRLHTIGLARYCIHPNYFGDLFTYSAWSLAAGTSCAMSLPTGMLWAFFFFTIPNSDAYLAGRYPDEFPEYARTTATLIPGLRHKKANLALGWLCLALSTYLSTSCGSQCG